MELNPKRGRSTYAKMAAASQTGPRASQPGGLGWADREASGSSVAGNIPCNS